MRIEKGNLQDKAIIPIRSINGGAKVRVKSIILNNFNISITAERKWHHRVEMR